MAQGSDARVACNGPVVSDQVVKASPSASASPSSSVSGSAARSIAETLDRLFAAAYPVVKGADWTSDEHSMPIPGAAPQKALVPRLPKAGADAHALATSSVPASGVRTEELPNLGGPMRVVSTQE